MQKQIESETDPIEESVWRVPRSSYPSTVPYEAHVIEQYKLAVEMADRVSARRMVANSFFVAIHTAIVAAIAFLAKEHLFTIPWATVVAFAGVMLLCLLWWQIITSYKNLNTAKYIIIGKIEKRLPLSIYDSEWKLVGEGRNKTLYNPMTHIEQLVPWAFMVIYACLAVIVLSPPAADRGDRGAKPACADCVLPVSR